jgi:polyketide cyclase/dehydrase/lipid transport protein
VRISASRELLASRPDVWVFLGEPYHLADWWPTVSGVEPDRRGAAAGARWQVVASREPTLLRKPGSTGMLVVTASDAPTLFAFHLTGEKLDVRVDLEATAADRTQATITVEGPWLIAYRRTLARRALGRLYALCQTAAAL